MAEPDCWLFLWATNRYLPKAFDVLEVWGFEYRQTLVWHKTGNPSPFGGSIAPNHAEFLLVARQGRATLSGRLRSSVVAANKPRNQHSAKPECFLDYIEQVSPGPYLELFARRNRFGWDTWGNESLEHVNFGA
jgi:N6-adenosine-specific RNA methylase IME4